MRVFPSGNPATPYETMGEPHAAVREVRLAGCSGAQSTNMSAIGSRSFTTGIPAGGRFIAGAPFPFRFPFWGRTAGAAQVKAAVTAICPGWPPRLCPAVRHEERPSPMPARSGAGLDAPICAAAYGFPSLGMTFRCMARLQVFSGVRGNGASLPPLILQRERICKTEWPVLNGRFGCRSYRDRLAGGEWG